MTRLANLFSFLPTSYLATWFQSPLAGQRTKSPTKREQSRRNPKAEAGLAKRNHLKGRRRA
jgi:hypothetical protein